jgi:hypothetical protein
MQLIADQLAPEIENGHRQQQRGWAARNVSPNVISIADMCACILVITVGCLHSAVVPRSWQSFHVTNLQVGVMALSLTVIIAVCLITIAGTLKRVVRVLT